jgi:hypothetical protein
MRHDVLNRAYPERDRLVFARPEIVAAIKSARPPVPAALFVLTKTSLP